MSHSTSSNPYRNAAVFIERNPTTGDARRVAMAMLSLYNAEDFPFSIRDCLYGDTEAVTLIVLMVADFANRGETEELRQAGAQVWKLFPGLVKRGAVMRGALWQWEKQHNL